MPDTATLAAPAQIKSAAISRVVLRARDPDRLATWYRDILGFELVGSAGSERLLGVGSETVLALMRLDDPRPRDPRAAGLFHTAFLMPDRASLAHWLRHALDHNVAIRGASDHNVSEALYLADPEGNGIEVYADLPESNWFDRNGNLVIRADALDVEGLLALAPKSRWSGAPETTMIGHLHLQVGETATAEAFYRDILGLDVMSRYSGGTFYGSGGYHHQLATNAWKSRGATAIDKEALGLAAYAMTFASAPEVDAIRRRAGAAELAIREMPAGFAVNDPWGIQVTVLGSG